MPSVDTTARARWALATLMTAWVAGSAGCAAPAIAPQAAPVPAAAVAVAAAAPTGAAVRVQAPVDPAARRSFDNAVALMRAGRSDEAERALRHLAQAQPELGGVHANLGLIQRQTGRTDESVASLEQAVRTSPRQPVFHNELGIAYRQQGQFAKARSAYERAIELDPTYAAAQLNLAILHDLYLNEPARALELYERYLAPPQNRDAAVGKWVADLRNRKGIAAPQLLSRKEPS